MSRWRVGVDVGGTKIAAGLVGSNGRIHAQLALPTPAAEGAQAVLDEVCRAVRELRARLREPDEVTGVGIGTGGVVDHRRGVIVSATGLLRDWAGTHVADELRDRLGLAISVDNDGNALALGEHRFGAGRGYADVLYVAVGTGIGGGLVIGGRLRRGAHHTAGELGHLPVPGAERRSCSCGGHGHIEALASGPAITAAYRRRSANRQAGDLRVVASQAGAGDLDAIEAIGDAATALGKVLAGLVNTIDPEAVVLGGGVARLGPVLWTPLTAAFRAGALPPTAQTPLLPAKLGPQAAIVGAASLVSRPERISPTARTGVHRSTVDSERRPEP
jgi:glucokinase